MVGRPRSAACDNAILDAARAEYAEHGYEGLSVDAVATRAGVSKATIYRRHPSKLDLVVAATCSICEAQPEPDLGSLRADHVARLEFLRAMLEDPVQGAVKRMLVLDSSRNEELGATHRDLMRQRREAVIAIFRRAIERGEMRADADLDFAVDQVVAPVSYRYLVMGERVTDAYIGSVVDAFVARYGVRVAV